MVLGVTDTLGRRDLFRYTEDPGNSAAVVVLMPQGSSQSEDIGEGVAETVTRGLLYLWQVCASQK